MSAGIPVAIEFQEQPMCCAISQNSSILATGLINGNLILHTYGPSTSGKGSDADSGKLPHLVAKELRIIAAHDDDNSCRAVAFVMSGSCIASGSSDTSLALFGTETGKIIRREEGAHASGITTVYSTAPDLLASGDEDGCIKLWDLRAKRAVMSYKKHTDFISGFCHHESARCLLACSGDGTLSSHDLRTHKCLSRTEEDADDELLTLAVMKNGKKVVAGTQSGVLNIYSWGAMKDCSDRFPGHPESVDAIAKFDETTLLTGSSDGAIRIVSLFPNKLVGLVGSHDEMPLECLSLSSDRGVLASASHDHTVKLWDLSFLLDDEIDGDEEEEEEEEPDDAFEVEEVIGLQQAGKRGGGADGTSSLPELATESAAKRRAVSKAYLTAANAEGVRTDAKLKTTKEGKTGKSDGLDNTQMNASERLGGAASSTPPVVTGSSKEIRTASQTGNEGEEDEDSDSDEEVDKKRMSKKQRKNEKTKWKKGSEGLESN
ncbi:hypothetical protein CEUSTIGMA_g4136.t1 [Chlamydomonas eustigma]|uniref:Uncharacterized protein n=1 Tax=Chlamydomonas eustigma TaxID=1157962 RepID=A0A250X1T0_9CHLO|nr:hypothetical protein CEUSTIGMA_g4136.t1 [Chlamydomonas eustigma]|eukprot:GAX76690.1 hypothetical protein CEUSTIGMA_g4136.t1 [Chlamydomonas eustigma]